jgi:hypothetical protein
MVMVFTNPWRLNRLVEHKPPQNHGCIVGKHED